MQHMEARRRMWGRSFYEFYLMARHVSLAFAEQLALWKLIPGQNGTSSLCSADQIDGKGSFKGNEMLCDSYFFPRGDYSPGIIRSHMKVQSECNECGKK